MELIAGAHRKLNSSPTDKQAIDTVIVILSLISEFDLIINYTIGKPSNNFVVSS